jgi:hypothetical protein
MDLQAKYPSGFKALCDLFGESKIEKDLPRLQEIFNTCEEAWEKNLDRFAGKPVKYLLFSEAPPWTEVGKEISYFYKTMDGAWVGRVIKAFFRKHPRNINVTLDLLGQKQFLLIQSLPFAMNYGTRRSRPGYLQLVRSCSDYFLSKIRDKRIQWADDVRVALAFKVNGSCLIEIYPNGIQIDNGRVLHFYQQSISADGSGYSNPDKLREIWGLE